MNFRVHCELDYALHGPATFLFALQCPNTHGQQVLTEDLTFTPFVVTETFSLFEGANRFARVKTWNPGFFKITYQADVATAFRRVSMGSLKAGGPEDIQPDALPFLFPSRYCQSDQLRQFAMNLFGYLNTPEAIAWAVSDWIFENITYVSGSSQESCSSLDTMARGQGVCRDFAHLGIALCRAMSIPARYTTCYSHQLNPPDFHACFEALLDGTWYLFDPTRMAPLNGLVRIASARDAADAAVCTTFGNPEPIGSTVSCQCIDLSFRPLTRGDLIQENQLITLL